MGTTVRIALDDDGVRLTWPKRCAACGEAVKLQPSTTRVGRVKSVRPNLAGGFTMKSDVMYVSTPMCAAHAGPNALANRILEKSPLMLMVRGWTYLFALMAVAVLIGLIAHRRSLGDLGMMGLFPLLGIAGIAAIAWARRNTHVRPVRFDPDMDVLEMDFRNTVYGAEFKRSNRDSTDSSKTEPLPWYRRSLLWKVVVLVLFGLFMAKLMRGG